MQRRAAEHMLKYKDEPFGRYATGDHLIAKNERSTAWDGSRYACILYDLGTQWTHGAPDATKNEDNCFEALFAFSGIETRVGSFRCDNAKELMNAAKTLAWANNLSLPHDKETNAIIERRVQHVLDGTRTT